MGDLRAEGPKSRRRAAARHPDAAPAPARTVPAGVSNHLLARVLSTGNPPAGATLQRVFQYKGKEVNDKSKMPTIHGAKAADLQKLAGDKKHDYGAITDAPSVAAAILQYATNNTVVVAPLALDEMYVGNVTVWNDDAFAQHTGQPVRATFQLDTGQGKHDAAFASGKDARKKTGGQQMPADTDYETLAQGVPAALTTARLTQIFAKAARETLDFAVQGTLQDDGYHYEISAMWTPLTVGRHILVYYHCYPPR
jgi:hypothetical protein